MVKVYFLHASQKLPYLLTQLVVCGTILRMKIRVNRVVWVFLPCSQSALRHREFICFSHV